jgi:hypothetical protein
MPARTGILFEDKTALRSIHVLAEGPQYNDSNVLWIPWHTR